MISSRKHKKVNGNPQFSFHGHRCLIKNNGRRHPASYGVTSGTAKYSAFFEKVFPLPAMHLPLSGRQLPLPLTVKNDPAYQHDNPPQQGGN